MFLGLALSNWMIWIVMILFILIYFVVTERMNRREEATDEDRSN
jgi:cytochrome c-type biogenesis protein CcmH/NrfF